MIPCSVRRVVVAKHGIDFRKQINGLLAESYHLGFDPYEGDCMVFVKKDRSQIRVLVGDEKGLYLISRRFEGGSIILEGLLSKGHLGRDISSAELSLLFEGASFTVHRKVKPWRKKTTFKQA
jgi:IS66 Orf2 like protein